MEDIDIETTNDEVFAELLRECYEYSMEESQHPSTRTSAMILDRNEILVKGVNNLPEGVESKEYRWDEENYDIYPNHAERDAIYKAAKKGIETEGKTMVMPWLPCIPCANAIISAGIKKLICHEEMIERTSERWQEELGESVKLMREAGIEILAYKGKVGAEAFMHGEKWEA